MTPKQLLSVNYSYDGFIYEFLSTFLLTLFIMIWTYFSKIRKNQKNNRIFLTSGYVLGTFLAFVIPWAWSFFISGSNANMLGNPIFVLLQSVLQGITIKPAFNFSPIFNGVFYLIGAQISGGIIGFICFIGLFYLNKWLLKNNEDVENLQNLHLQDLFVKSPKCLIRFSIKEAIFIFAFTIITPFLFYINNVYYGTSTWVKLIFMLIFIWFILFISSFFGFFCFHLIFPILKIIAFLIPKNGTIDKKGLIKASYEFLIALVLTISIAFICAFGILGIAKNSGMKLNF